jgi:hypothetical protein
MKDVKTSNRWMTIAEGAMTGVRVYANECKAAQ